MFVVGDVHGYYERLVELLRDEARLINADLRWVGGSSTLWFIGDYVDRGPNGIGVIDLIMRLQHEAPESGGQVGALLGNHDLLLLAAHRFDQQGSRGPGGTFAAAWLRNGGRAGDLEHLTKGYIDWFAALTAMVLVGDRLLVHADSMLYIRYGHSVEAVNQAFRTILSGSDADAWDILLDAFGEHQGFSDDQPNGRQRARRFLSIYGGRQIIHGHTPISKITGEAPRVIVSPLVYANGRCINIDGGMYLGGSGFVYETT